MYHDKTIYILKAHVEESVMGRVFFSRGGTPSPHRGGAHRGGITPQFFKIIFFSKIIYFLIEDTLLSILSEKKFPGGSNLLLLGGKTE